MTPTPRATPPHAASERTREEADRTPLALLILIALLPTLTRAEAPLIISTPTTLPLAQSIKTTEVHHAQNGWTYNHHPDMAAWHNRPYIAWNQCEKDEDTWPSRNVYSTSTDGTTWTQPTELFPPEFSTALRMYFFHAPNGKMLAIAGLRTSHNTVDERAKGGAIVREIRPDHSLGPVYMLRSPDNPPIQILPTLFDADHDEKFIEACQELLANKPFLEQQDYGTLLGDRRMRWHDVNTWPADEPSRKDFPRFGKATAFFHRKDNTLVGIMKWGWVITSTDEGETWSPPTRPPTLITGMAKVWPQRITQNHYALVYNPHPENRYPLVMVTSEDGIHFTNMRILNNDHPPLRFPGKYKVEGPQYPRGISEWSTDGSFKDDAMWVAYSLGKEDIYLSRIAIVDAPQK